MTDVGPHGDGRGDHQATAKGAVSMIAWRNGIAAPLRMAAEARRRPLAPRPEAATGFLLAQAHQAARGEYGNDDEEQSAARWQDGDD
jgi:hypothetical protein